MKPLRLALFFILLIFHLIVVILSLNFTQSLADSIVRNPLAFRFLALFGLIVFLITFAFVWFDRRAARRKIEKLEAEKNTIKAEVFDMRKREREIDQEIDSFEKSLSPTKSTSAKPTTWSKTDADKPSAAQPDAAQPSAAEPNLTKPHLTGSRPTESRPAESDQVEYGPLKPKQSDSRLAEPPSGESDSMKPRPTELRPDEPSTPNPAKSSPAEPDTRADTDSTKPDREPPFRVTPDRVTRDSDEPRQS